MNIHFNFLLFLTTCSFVIGIKQFDSSKITFFKNSRNYLARDTKVIGGNAASKPYPYQVSIQLRASAFMIPIVQTVNGWAHNCGGSIVTTRHIVTAAHCLADYSKIENLSILVGTQQLRRSGTRYNLENTLVHPDYVPLRSSDIAIAKTNKTIEFKGNKVQPISYSDNFIKENVPVTLTGWGYTNIFRVGGPANNLQEVQLKTIANEECSQQHSHITDKEICTFTKIGKGACGGDSGGPLTKENMLVGIVSRGTKICAIGRPDVYTRVSTFFSWIQDNTKE